MKYKLDVQHAGIRFFDMPIFTRKQFHFNLSLRQLEFSSTRFRNCCVWRHGALIRWTFCVSYWKWKYYYYSSFEQPYLFYLIGLFPELSENCDSMWWVEGRDRSQRQRPAIYQLRDCRYKMFVEIIHRQSTSVLSNAQTHSKCSPLSCSS